MTVKMRINHLGNGAIALCGALCSVAQASIEVRSQLNYSGHSVPNEVIVRFKQTSTPTHFRYSQLLKGLSNKSRFLTMRQQAGAQVTQVRPSKVDERFGVIRVASAESVDTVMGQLASDPEVDLVEVNQMYYALDMAAPNDKEFSKLWGMSNSGQKDPAGQTGVGGIDLNVLPLWNEGVIGNTSVVVAVIDSGVDYRHPDLKANIFTNTRELNGKSGVDDDGNGFIDDTVGWNFGDDNNNPMDDNGHGTHVAGTIGGVGNNGIGIVGVNQKVRILPIKFLSSWGGGTLEDAIDAIRYSKLMGAQVVNNSWGGGGFSQLLKDAVEETTKAGMVFLAAAGNDGSDNDSVPSYPANYDLPNVISVAAIDNRGNLASFSNYGKTKVHVAAPGVNIFSTAPNGKYQSMSGTSMATPHVAGVAALMLSTDAKLTYQQIKKQLIATSDSMSSLQGEIVSGGRVNAYRAVKGNKSEPDVGGPKRTYIEKSFETAHPYLNSKRYTTVVRESGAKEIRIHFKKIQVEKNYDFVVLYDAKGTEIQRFTGNLGGFYSKPVMGESVTIKLITDGSVTDWGLAIDGYEVLK